MIDFKIANDKLNRDVIGVCQRYLPRGVRKGDWWLASTPWRIDKNPSLGVNLHSGKWQDFAFKEERGDLIDLIARVTGQTATEVVKDVCGDGA